jgi:hypothetical protein
MPKNTSVRLSVCEATAVNVPVVVTTVGCALALTTVIAINPAKPTIFDGG